MTLPYERYNALRKARAFLLALLDPRQTPRVPRSIRREAYYTLKHYPVDYEIDDLSKKCPKILQNNKK